MVEMVKTGSLPLWNPYIYCGYPLMATLQVGFFYPFSILHYILPFHLAFNYFTFIHYYLALLFMYWLMRYFQFSRGASILSAITFAFSGYLLSMVTMNTTLTSLIWLPLILLIYDKAIKKFTLGKFILLSILLAVQFLGGEPTVLYLTAIFLFFYGLVEGIGSWQAIAMNIFTFLCALATAAGLSAIQLIPFIEVLLNSYRVLKTDYAFITTRCFPPEELLNFISPYFFGNIMQNTYLDIMRGGRYQAWLISPYIGILPVIYSLFSLNKLNKRYALLWGMLLLSLFLALGRYTPLFYWFYNFLPGVTLIRYPVKYLSLAFFVLPILAGVGFERFRKNIDRKMVLNFLVGYLFILVLWIFAKLNFNHLYLFFRSFYPAKLPNYPEMVIFNLLNSNLRSLFFILVFLGATLFVSFLFYRKAMGEKLFVFTVVLIIFVDLFSANFGINPAASTSIMLSPTPNLNILLKDKGPYRCFALDTMFPARSPDEVLFQLKDKLEVNLPALHGISALFGKESMEPPGFMYLFKNYREGLVGGNKPLADMMDVKYLFLSKKLNRSDVLLLREKNLMGFRSYLYQNLSVLPRGYLVDSVRIIKGEKETFKYLTSPAFDPRREVVLEEPIDLEQRDNLKGKAEIIKYEPNQVQISVLCNKKTICFLSDSYYPGWKAFLDGKETKILRANWLFRAVVVPAGQHLIIFKYDPFSFKLGMIISLFTAALLGLAGLIRFQKRIGLRQQHF